MTWWQFAISRNDQHGSISRANSFSEEGKEITAGAVKWREEKLLRDKKLQTISLTRLLDK